MTAARSPAYTAIACLLAAGVVTFGLVYRTGAASGADAYGYVSEADLWRAGTLHIPQEFVKQLPWPDPELTATPIGYRPAATTEVGPIVPWYSAGLPMLLAVAKTVGGQAAMFWVVPLFGGLLVIATFFIGRRVGGAGVGLAAAFLVALSPIVLFMTLFPMTDVVVAATWAAATWAALGDSRRRAGVAGLLAGLAILIRPNLVAVGLLMGVWMIARDARRGPRWWSADRAALFALASAPGIAIVMLVNRALYGSPFVSGYGTLGSVLHWANILPNLRHYASWMSSSETPVIALGLVALALPVAAVWRDRDRAFDAALLTLVAVGTLSCYLLFMPLDEWWYLRFLMTMWPGVFVGLSWWLFRNAGPARRILAAALVIAIGAHSVWFAQQRRMTKAAEGERRSITAAHLVRDRTEPNSAVFAYTHSGSVRYYGERMTLRYDQIAPEWLDPGVAWLTARGVHPYLLVEAWELEQWKARFGPTSARGRMNMRVVFELQWPTHMWLFDLAAPASDSWPVILGYDRPPVPRSVPPAAAPALVLR
ncbi:MAG: hypothetical protein EPO35_06025 [Acidobacteria bacterium]|nr:MAG: hypothetical protein EPO35_06025 [Acidobacteriota bacterium]